MGIVYLKKKKFLAAHMNKASYLKHFCTYFSGSAPLSAQLHREGLSIFSEYPHPDCVHKHSHHTQALLLNRVEKNQVPLRGEKNGGE